MIQTSALQKLVIRFESTLRERWIERPEDEAELRCQWQTLRDENQTSESWVAWSDAQITQAAVAWVLSCVFVRFLEDNGWEERTYLAGAVADERGQNRLQWAIDNQVQFFRDHPAASDREYLEHVFQTWANRPGFTDLFGPGHNPLWRLRPTAAGATELLSFFRKTDGDTGTLLHSLRAPTPSDTRVLGDLYQDLSEAARKRYALLQTPDFVEEFILDRTLEPALRTFGLQPDGGPLRLIDPTCGSGHFLLGAFARLFERWQREAPGLDKVAMVQKVLDSLHGVDLNPFAVAIARFRLLLAAYHACGARILGGPAFRLNLAVGDSLLHGPGELGLSDDLLEAKRTWHADLLVSAEYDLARQILVRGRYHAVVGNPPYIAVSDSSQREAIKALYPSCFKKWTLSAPFVERFFQLAIKSGSPRGEAGFVGLINSNNFTKREFGKKLIESFFPTVELTEVLDTSGCNIPGHNGTPTVILCGRNRPGSKETPVRAVLGIRGEPGCPDNAAEGQVWSALVREVDHPGAETPWLSVVDADRATFAKHPWSLGGGGAGELKEAVEGERGRLSSLAESAGIVSFTLEDDLYVVPSSLPQRFQIQETRPLVVGDAVRDWGIGPVDPVLFPYDSDFKPLPWVQDAAIFKFMGPYRTSIASNVLFGGVTKVGGGLKWYEFGRLTASKLRTPLSIAFAFVGTHNHFVLCRGGMVFKQTAPVIKLPPTATLDDHLDLLSLLNTSTLAFWFRQVCMPKNVSTGEAWESRLEHDSTKIAKAPLATSFRAERLALVRELDALGQELSNLQPARLFAHQAPTQALLESTALRVQALRERSIALQEELDWWVYAAYGLISETERVQVTRPLDQAPTALSLGERAFEIHLARQVDAGEQETSWFERHGSTPCTELPARWSEADRAVVQARLDLIESHPWVGLLERPEHKRRWAGEPWRDQAQKALASWLCDHLEGRAVWSEPCALSVYELSDRLGHDAAFVEACRLYAPGQDRAVTLAALLAQESVPAQAARRYTESGLRKRAEWEETWALQRREDAGETLDIPVPSRYDSKDFQKASYWSQRGKLDVPRERFVALPDLTHASDPSALYLWAGFDHGERALALIDLWSASAEGWTADQKLSLLVALHELLPWLHQWHGNLDARTGETLAGAVETWLAQNLGELGRVRADLALWRPTAAPTARRGRKPKIEED